MKRSIVAVALVSLVVASFAAPAQAGKKAKPRKVELTYSEPAYGTAGLGVCFQGASCAFFGDPLKGERRVSIEVTDELGTDVYASLIQDTNEDGNYLATDDLTVHFCGATEEPVAIEADKAVSVWVWQGPGANPPCPGGASSGTITATFTR